MDIPHPRTQLKKASILSLQLLTNKNDIKDLIDNIKQASHMLTPKEIDELREIEESLDLVHSTSPIRKMKKSKEKEENKEAKEEYVDEHKEEQDEDKKNDAEIKENKTVSRRDMFLQLLEKSSSQNLFESIKKNLEGMKFSLSLQDEKRDFNFDIVLITFLFAISISNISELMKKELLLI